MRNLMDCHDQKPEIHQNFQVKIKNLPGPIPVCECILSAQQPTKNHWQNNKLLCNVNFRTPNKMSDKTLSSLKDNRRLFVVLLVSGNLKIGAN